MQSNSQTQIMEENEAKDMRAKKTSIDIVHDE
jgi:hypothetical protein